MNENEADENGNETPPKGGTFNKPKIIASIEQQRIDALTSLQEMVEGVKSRDIPLESVGDLMCSIKHIDDVLSQLKRHPEEPDRMHGIAIGIARQP